MGIGHVQGSSRVPPDHPEGGLSVGLYSEGLSRKAEVQSLKSRVQSLKSAGMFLSLQHIDAAAPRFQFQ